MLKYQHKIDHTHVFGWVKIVNKLQHMHGVMVEKARYKQRPEELLHVTDKPRNTLHVTLGCADGTIT